jgi:hypothetical protein
MSVIVPWGFDLYPQRNGKGWILQNLYDSFFFEVEVEVEVKVEVEVRSEY